MEEVYRNCFHYDRIELWLKTGMKIVAGVFFANIWQ
jgi:hypothetical protein